jgi:hypothetical protein
MLITLFGLLVNQLVERHGDPPAVFLAEQVFALLQRFVAETMAWFHGCSC